MEMEASTMRFFLILTICIFAHVTSAAVRKSVDDLAGFRTEVMQLGARLSSLEKEIINKTNLYSSSLEQIKQFESDIKLYKDELVKKQNEVQHAQKENKEVLQSYLLETENDSSEIWQKKIHLELLKRAQKKLATKDKELQELNARVTDFDVKLDDLRTDEEQLSVVLRELQDRKKIVMESYLEKLESKKKLESKVQNEKIHQKVSSIKKQLSDAPLILAKPDRIFKDPVKDYLGLTSSPKGVTFKYKSIQPVRAVGDGKVVFAGDLAAYGQVVLLDHGNDLRTVLLGRMNVKVKKNDSVRDGEVLAYTLNDLKEPQNLYFEVRKKNTAQNTILWLEQNGVSKI
jgi:murein DD-endopeptidase MepM/ murein hydrolase activator NlpD